MPTETDRKFRLTNVGFTDSKIRMAVGILLFLVSATTNLIGLWGVLGVIPLITGFMRFCPLYSLVGLNTCARA